jgi:hypothetical protein
VSEAQEAVEADPGEKRREINRRYNLSAKGQRRNKRYEAAHPERVLRWERARNAMRPGGAP